jgi:DNA-directed RNA polymerase subunit RPC12/RpoP
MLEYQPVSSSQLSAIERPRCPACSHSRMILSQAEPGPNAFDFRTFECQKCGHVHKMTIAKDPMDSNLRGWLDSELRPPE